MVAHLSLSLRAMTLPPDTINVKEVKMRKEDKVRLPAKLKVKLPQGFQIDRIPEQYALYFRYPVVNNDHKPTGTMTDLVAIFSGDSTPQEIEIYALQAAERLKEKLAHSHGASV